MEPFKYFIQDGNTYVKIPQRALYYTFAILLLGGAVLAFTYGQHTRGSMWLMALLGILGVLLLMRAGATTTFDVQNRTITAQSFFFTKPKEFHFDDFDCFLISKQRFLITLNATATLILAPKGKRLNLLLHQTMFVTRPLQNVVDETARILEMANGSQSNSK